LEDIIGGKHALYLTSLYFGIGHFYGVPSGVIGIILSSFLGYILGKSMLETRGFFWAFSLHCFFPHKMTEDFSQFLSAKEEKAA
jgi:ABC-type glycerol-3-phosphate transport system permease component